MAAMAVFGEMDFPFINADASVMANLLVVPSLEQQHFNIFQFIVTLLI